jgi:SagB-type dehydrogenase family enzyme
MNQRTWSAEQYHEQTTFDRFDLRGGRRLDWGGQPVLFKRYGDLPRVDLPTRQLEGRHDLIGVIQGQAGNDGSLDAQKLSNALFRGYGLTGRSVHPGAIFYYRSVASAGALYPGEVYAALDGVEGVEDGLYYLDVAEHELVRLRGAGSVQAAMAAAGLEADLQGPAAVFFVSAIFFRSAWKYGERAYRYCLLDTGHLAENLGLALADQGLPFSMHYDFDDEAVNELLCVDEPREGCMAVLAVPGMAQAEPRPMQQPEPTAPREELERASRVAPRDELHAAINGLHESGEHPPERNAEPPTPVKLGLQPEDWLELDAAPRPEAETYSESVITRRSRRNFTPAPLDASLLRGLLEPLCLDHAAAPAQAGVHLELLLQEVEGVPAGRWLLDREGRRLGRLDPEPPGALQPAMARAALGQEWLRGANLHACFVTNPAALEKGWGPRGYRYALLTAGRLGQRLYLAATGLRLGACAVGAYFDREAAEVLGLARGGSLAFLVASGRLKG